MAQLATLKKPKHLHTSISNKTARHSYSFGLSSLISKQSFPVLSISKHNILISAPTQPIPNQIHFIAGDLYNHNRTHVQKTHIDIIRNYHQKNALTHIEWNQKGNAFASIDEIGKLALWKLEGPTETWKMEYSVDLKQPVASFIWLNSEREYTDDLVREPKVYFRNPYGYLAFLTVTVYGEIKVHYQHSGTLFSNFSTHIPKVSRHNTKQLDASCFGMSLYGMNDWQHISHAAITSEKDGIYLATHHTSTQQKSIDLYLINLKFPKMEKKGAIRCRQVASTHFKEENLSITHIGFTKTDHGPQLYTSLGGGIDKQWYSCIQHWDLEQKDTTSNLDTDNFLKGSSKLLCRDKISIEGNFITCLKPTKSGHLVLGLSDGSLHIELSKENAVKNNLPPSYLPGFWSVVQPNNSDFIKDFVLSPNETHIIYTLESGQLNIARATPDTLNDEQVHSLTLQLQCCLFKNTDVTDLISELVRLSKQPGFEDKPTEIIDNVLTSYELHHKNQGDWNIGQLQKAYGFALAALSRLPNKQTQSINISRGMQLPTILECFISSCLDYKSIEKIFNKEEVSIEFDSSSFWSLALLSSWVFDFVKWILHEWDMQICSKKAPVTDKKPVHSILFVHKESREYLLKILLLIQRFIQYSNNNHYQLDHLPESQPVLQKYIKTLEEETPIKIDEVINLLNDIANIECHEKVNNRWSMLLNSTLYGYAIPELQEISSKYKEKCAQTCLYVKKEIIEDYDPIRKRKLTNNVKTNLCIQCHQHILPIHTESDVLDPCSSAQWYQSLGRRCVCGGMFISM